MSKITTLINAASLVEDGMMVAFGGNVLHRAPMAFIRELVRQNKKNLKAIKTAGAHDIDLLAAGGCLASVDAGFISYETKFGLASHYRRAVQKGVIKANEHACYTVISALRAATIGAGFMPVTGLKISDLIEANDYFKHVEDPFTGEKVTAVKKLQPDIAIIHLQECDEEGNGIIYGPRYEDVLLAEASKKVIITTERIVEHNKFLRDPNLAAIPGFMVDVIVKVPKGAKPCGCPEVYDIDEEVLMNFVTSQEESMLNTYLSHYEDMDYHNGLGVL